MARAYRFADDGGPMPHELMTLRAIERFGVQAVTGRTVLRTRDIRAMWTASTVVNAYRARQSAGSSTYWEWENPDLAALLRVAKELANG